MKTLLCWSSGKDSAWSLHVLRQRADVEVVGLVTMISQSSQRVAMHGIRLQLLKLQAKAAGLPLRVVPIPEPCSNVEYEAAMSEVVLEARGNNVECMAFGDLFLEDIRAYREARLAGTGLSPIFPLWGEPTDELARHMIGGGLRARITCIAPQLDAAFVGREYDESFLADLPTEVDPCGERGEFHTFVYDGPMFNQAMHISLGRVVQRDGYTFADFLLAK